jgi:hypothetical protein
MRKKTPLLVALAATTMLSFIAPQAARADHGWLSVGSAFRIGGANISFLFGQPARFHGLNPGYFVRFDRPVAYHDHHCTEYCYRDAGSYYHHESCPVVSAYFGSHQVDPYWAFDRYAPQYGAGYYGYYSNRGHRGGGYYDGYRRHDRYDRYRDDSVYRDRGWNRDGDHRYDRNRRDGRDHRYDRDRRDGQNRRDGRDHRDGRRDRDDRQRRHGGDRPQRH